MIYSDPCGHENCRSHSFCSYEVEGVRVWHPDECMVCWDQWLQLSDPQVRQGFSFI